MIEIIKFKSEFEKELLRLGVKTKFLKNRIEYCNKEGGNILDINRASSFADFTILAFYWAKTPEGSKFWEDICHGIKPIK